MKPAYGSVIRGLKGEKGDPGERGPAGPPGPPGKSVTGPPGKDGRDGKDAPQIDYEGILEVRLNELRLEFDAKLANLAPNPLPDHIVVIYKEDAGYAYRIGSLLTKAQDKFTPITATQPTSYAGQLPAIVAYKRGSPISMQFGERAVAAHLSAIARGNIDVLYEKEKGM